MIKQIEYAIVHRAWEEGWIQPVPPAARSGRRVAVVGSGPAGLAVAQQLNHAGHAVVVYERDEGPGGLLRFGVPDAKLEKWIIDRRVDVLEERGHRVPLRRRRRRATCPWSELRRAHDAVIVATGSRVPRDADVPGRDLAGVDFAMDYLYQRNRWVAREEGRPRPRRRRGQVISAAGKHVVVIGGGDTGMDCVSRPTARAPRPSCIYDVYPSCRRGPLPGRAVARPQRRTADDLRARRAAASARFGHEITAHRRPGRPRRRRRGPPGHRHVVAQPRSRCRARVHDAGRPRARRDRLHPPGARGRSSTSSALELDARGNVKAGAAFETSVDGVFACGDARRGQSLVVTAIAEGRRCARAVDRWLAGAPAAVAAASTTSDAQEAAQRQARARAR